MLTASEAAYNQAYRVEHTITSFRLAGGPDTGRVLWLGVRPSGSEGGGLEVFIYDTSNDAEIVPVSSLHQMLARRALSELYALADY